jgi:hypothetical protein
MSVWLSTSISENPNGRLLEKFDFGSSTKTCPKSPNLVKNRVKISGTSYEEDLRTLYYCGLFEWNGIRLLGRPKSYQHLQTRRALLLHIHCLSWSYIATTSLQEFRLTTSRNLPWAGVHTPCISLNLSFTHHIKGVWKHSVFKVADMRHN